MSVSHVVVDGSNLATEGRTLPSLQQLDEAVRAFIEQYEPAMITVVVDASFPNRVDAAEKAAFEEAVINSELVTPPAGVIGRGDAFLLEIADRANAVVLSNDSFQEFHGQFSWLFDQGRLVGGKPVPHVGWVFMERAPVRGPLSRKSVSEAREAARKAAAAKKSTAKEPRAKATARSTKAASKAPSRKAAAASRRSTAPAEAPVPAAALVTDQGSVSSSNGGRRRRGRGRATVASEPAREAYNDLLPFIEFVAAHPAGSIVEGSVERFSSHGAYVIVEGARCYLPLKNMADPPPRSARELLKVGELHPFVIQAFDTPRRGVDLAIPGVVPLPTVAPEHAPATADVGSTAGETTVQPKEEELVAPAKKAARKKAASKRARKSTAKKAARRAPARKATKARKSTKKAAARRRAPARKSAKKATKRTAKRATKRTAKRATKRTAKRATKRTAKRATKRTAKRATKRGR